MIVRPSRNSDYAKVQLYVNDQEPGEVGNTHHQPVELAEETDPGVFDVHEEQNRLTIETVGASEQAVNDYESGVGYIKLK